MKTSESISELAAALAVAQAAMPAIPKNGRGQVGQQPTSYVTFDDLVTTVRAPLADNGLSFTQMLDEGPSLTTVLLHKSGQWIASSTPVDAMEANKGTNAMQAFGSTLTYLKRYALAAMLGVVSDEDDDGRSATRGNGHKPAARPQRAAPAQAPAQPPDAWDAEEQAAPSGESALPYIDVAEVGVFLTKAGKPHVGLMTEGHQWPDIRWWQGRDALLEAAPWLIESCTKDALVEGARFPFKARVYYTEDSQGYKTAEAFDRVE